LVEKELRNQYDLPISFWINIQKAEHPSLFFQQAQPSKNGTYNLIGIIPYLVAYACLGLDCLV